MSLKDLPWLQYLYGFLFYVIVFLCFLILKFGHIVLWPWLWVFSPLWVPIGITAVALTGYFIYLGVHKLFCG